MGIRNWLNNRPRAMVLVAVPLLAVAVVYLVVSNRGPGEKEQRRQWYYDLGSETLFEDAFGKISPFTSPTDAEAVEAVLYFCGECGGEPNIVYLLKQSDAAHAILSKLLEDNGEAFYKNFIGGGDMVSLVDPVEWISIKEPAALEIMRTRRKCPDGLAMRFDCFGPK